MSVFRAALTNEHDATAIATLRRDAETWRAIAHQAVHTLAEAQARVAALERQLAEARDEARRYAREAVER